MDDPPDNCRMIYTSIYKRTGKKGKSTKQLNRKFTNNIELG